MEYAVNRAYEIKRLSYENLISLHIKETNFNRCLYPHEIQDKFVLPPIKAAYLIPEIEAAQASQTMRIKGEFYKEKIYPSFGYLSPLDVERVHKFDSAISEANIDMVFQGSKKPRFRDQLGEE